MRIVDDIVLDPVEFVPDRAELNLSEEGLSVVEADFGEADVEAFMVRQELGEIPVDRHPPDTQTVLKLQVRGDGEVDLPTAAYRLQQKVGLLNREGGWLRRDFKYEGAGKFAGSLGRQIKKATLSGLGSWQRGNSPDVLLSMVTGPFWYATEEAESELFSETVSRELQFELAEILGTGPGLIRFSLTNDNLESPWRGVILALESEDHPQDETKDTTAALAYDAVALTPLGGSSEAEREGVEVVRHENITGPWRAILGLEVSGVGPMTHFGTRRIYIRPYDFSTEAEDLEFRLEYRTNGAARWSQGPITSSRILHNWSLIDLGECRLDRAVIGDQKWEGRILARSTGAEPGKVDIHRVYPLPAEQMLLGKYPVELRTPETLEAADSYRQSAGSLTGKKDETAHTYVAFPGSAAGDFAIDTDDDRLERATAADSGEIFGVLGEGRAVGLGLNLADVAASIDIDITDEDSTLDLTGQIGAGLMIRAKDSENFTLVKLDHSSAGWHARLLEKVEGEERQQRVIPLQPAHNLRLNLSVVAEGNFIAVFTATPGGFVERCFSHELMNEAAGGVYVYDENAGGGTMARYYDNFAVWVPDSDAIAFPQRALELRSDGAFREDEGGGSWGRVVLDGFPPNATPSSNEGRAMRGIVIPTQGDLEDLPDSGVNKASARVLVRPAYHFAREAAVG